MRRWTRPRRRALLLELLQWLGAALIVVGVLTLFVGDPHFEISTLGLGLALLKALGNGN